MRLLGALDVSNNSVMEIKRLLCKPTSPEIVSALFLPLFPDKFQHSSGQDRPGVPGLWVEAVAGGSLERLWSAGWGRA